MRVVKNIENYDARNLFDSSLVIMEYNRCTSYFLYGKDLIECNLPCRNRLGAVALKLLSFKLSLCGNLKGFELETMYMYMYVLL